MKKLSRNLPKAISTEQPEAKIVFGAKIKATAASLRIAALPKDELWNTVQPILSRAVLAGYSVRVEKEFTTKLHSLNIQLCATAVKAGVLQELLDLTR